MLRARTARDLLLSGFALVPAVLLALGCTDDENKGYAPSNCKHSEPTTGFLRVELTINQTNHRVPLTIFEGAYEEGKVVLRDTVDVEDVSYELRVGKEYSVLARYISGRDTILALDSESLDVASDEYQDATCYYVEEGKADVRLHD
jgi:hypothetical protein